MTTKKSQNNESHALAIGAGLAAVAAAAAGAYYLYGTEKGQKKRQEMKSWMLKMKADVMDEIEQLQDVNETLYAAAVAKVAEKYKQLKNIDPQEVVALAARMQGHWKNIRKDLNGGVKMVKKVTKKPAKTKKVAKK